MSDNITIELSEDTINAIHDEIDAYISENYYKKSETYNIAELNAEFGRKQEAIRYLHNNKLSKALANQLYKSRDEMSDYVTYEELEASYITKSAIRNSFVEITDLSGYANLDNVNTFNKNNVFNKELSVDFDNLINYNVVDKAHVGTYLPIIDLVRSDGTIEDEDLAKIRIIERINEILTYKNINYCALNYDIIDNETEDSTFIQNVIEVINDPIIKEINEDLDVEDTISYINQYTDTEVKLADIINKLNEIVDKVKWFGDNISLGEIIRAQFIKICFLENYIAQLRRTVKAGIKLANIEEYWRDVNKVTRFMSALSSSANAIDELGDNGDISVMDLKNKIDEIINCLHSPISVAASNNVEQDTDDETEYVEETNTTNENNAQLFTSYAPNTRSTNVGDSQMTPFQAMLANLFK